MELNVTGVKIRRVYQMVLLKILEISKLGSNRERLDD
jgi:hypothetical protein